VREAQSELQVLPLATTGNRCRDLQDLLVTLGHADDHVGDQGTGEAVQLLGLALVVGAVDVQLARILSDR